MMEIGQGVGIDNNNTNQNNNANISNVFIGEEKRRIQSIQLGIDLGLTFIDTAEIYGNGYSEEIVGEAIKDYDKDTIFIATKVSPEHLKHDDVIKSCNDSLRRLNTNHIDLYQIHWPNPTIPLEDTLSAMRYLKDKDKIGNVGVCNFSLLELELAQSIADNFDMKIISNQVEYNLIDRTIEEDLLQFCDENNILIIGYSPLKWTNNLSRYQTDLLNQLANKYNKTIYQIILRWITYKDIIPIPSSMNLNHVKENAQSADFDIYIEDIKLIDKTFKSDVVYIPMEEIKVDEKDIDNLVPHPKDLATYYRNNIQSLNQLKLISIDNLDKKLKIKPIKVRKMVRNIENDDNAGKYKYKLIEGRAKYLAWKYAFDGKRDIRSLIL